MLVRLINTIRSWLWWRYRARQETFVASNIYAISWTKKGEETGDQTVIICSFFVDGNGLRYSRTEQPDTETGSYAVEQHDKLRQDRHNWREFGDLPANARRPTPKGKVVLIHRKDET